jgi:serine/threonine protein kinase
MSTNIGRFQILDKLGEGGMGVVFLAMDPELNRTVAIKQLRVDSDDALARFYREARAAGQLQHRNIVRVFEFGEDDGSPFIVMEYISGPSLKSRMTAPEGLTAEAKLTVLEQVLAGLQHAHHHGVFHRDIKPGNIVLTPDNHAKILDFGIAKLADTEMTRSLVVLGTLPYMSPEQVKGESIDGRSDLFSVGVMLYELFSGRRPFDAAETWETMKRIACEPPPALGKLGLWRQDLLEEILGRALDKERHRRFQTATEMAEALAGYREQLRQPHQAGSQDLDARQLFERGKQQYQKGDYWRAMNSFWQVLSLVPDHPPSIKNLRLSEQAWRRVHARELERIGLLLWKRREYGVAVRTFEELLQLEPQNEYARWLCVLARRRLAARDEQQDMVQLFERAMADSDGAPACLDSLRAQMDAALEDDSLVVASGERAPEAEPGHRCDGGRHPEEPRDRTSSRITAAFRRLKNLRR